MGAEAKIGPYAIVRRLGMGGTSEVLLATSSGPHGFERRVVIKRLLPDRAVDPQMARMLGREAMAYARLGHPAIVRLYDFFAADGHLALVLEHIDGLSLARLRAVMRGQRQKFSDATAFYIMKRVFSALAAAHAAKDPLTGAPAPVIHRDVSPGNVLVPWDGFVKLADFGIAKVAGTPSDTVEGLIKGTDGYMAPEQVTASPVTTRTDVYAGCVLLRELLTGVPAFSRGSLPEFEFLRTMAQPRLRPIESMRKGISPALARAIRRGLEPDPERRTLSAEEMVAVLAREGDSERGKEDLASLLKAVRPIHDAEEEAMRRAEGPRQEDIATRAYASSGSFAASGPGAPARASAVISTPLAYGAPAPELPALPIVRARRRRGLGIAIGGLVVAGLAAFAFVARGRLTSAAAAAPSAPSAKSVVAVAALAARPPDPAPPLALAPAPAATTGEVRALSSIDHRVFVDGKVCGSTSAPIVVLCGEHSVRVGSAGTARVVDVPCGGAVDVR